jgi:hypothetical protein
MSLNSFKSLKRRLHANLIPVQMNLVCTKRITLEGKEAKQFTFQTSHGGHRLSSGLCCSITTHNKTR